MTYEIDKGVPIPETRGRAMKYPFRDMDVGDSIFIPGKKADQIRGSIAYMAPKKFARRTVTENGVKGVRVWRIE